MDRSLIKPLALDIDPLAGSLPLEEELVRKHCNVDIADDDDLLAKYQRSSILWAEGEMHRTVVPRLHRWQIACFPVGPIRLPRGKTQAVSSIEYVSAGESLVLNGPTSSPVGTGYQENLADADGGRLFYPEGGGWPGVDSMAIAPVQITFTAGYAAGEIPEDIVTAILFGISDMYEIRGSMDIERASGAGRTLELRRSLLSQYALHRWYAGTHR